MIGILVIFTGCAGGMGSFLKMESQAPEIKTNEMPDEYLKDEMSIPYFMVTFIPDEVTLKRLKDNIREAIVYDEDINDIEKEKQLEKLDSLHYENKKIVWVSIRASKLLLPKKARMKIEFPGNNNIVENSYSVNYKVTKISEYGSGSFWMYQYLFELNKPVTTENYENLPILMKITNFEGKYRTYMLDS
jgi:hypothetical protein